MKIFYNSKESYIETSKELKVLSNNKKIIIIKLSKLLENYGLFLRAS